MKSILLLIESLRINETSSGIVSSTFVKLMHSSGYHIKIVAPRTINYRISWLPGNIDIRLFNLPVRNQNLLDSIPKLRALPTYLTGLHSDFRRLINEWKSEICNELGMGKYDVIYVLGSGSEFAPHFAISEIDPDVPVVINFHDPFPMHLYPEPYRARRSRINKLLEKKIGNAIGMAYRISFPSEFLMDLMAKTFPLIKNKGFVLPHIGTELKDLPESGEDDLISLDSDKVNILHAGSLLGPRNPNQLLQSIMDIHNNRADLLKNVRFVFVGKMAKELKHFADNVVGDCIRFYDCRISYKKSLELISRADCMLVIEAISDFSPFMPGKLADIAFCEKPVIALTPKKSEIMRLLGDDYPYYSDLGDKQGITIAIIRFLSDFENQNVNKQSIKRIKEYVSIERNSLILNRILG